MCLVIAVVVFLCGCLVCLWRVVCDIWLNCLGYRFRGFKLGVLVVLVLTDFDCCACLICLSFAGFYDLVLVVWVGCWFCRC